MKVKAERTWKRKRRGINAARWPFCLYPNVEYEMNRIGREARSKPLLRSTVNQDTLINAARAVERHLIGSEVSDRFEIVLGALGLKPERAIIEDVIRAVHNGY